jgi:hypothetical protein
MEYSKYLRHGIFSVITWKQILLSTSLSILLISTLPSQAHHSVAMYDNDNLIDKQGVITRIEWTSPHVFLFFESIDASDNGVEWSVELDAPVLLRRYGWNKDTLGVGDEVTFNGAPARSGSPSMRGVIITMADGIELRVWSRV